MKKLTLAALLLPLLYGCQPRTESAATTTQSGMEVPTAPETLSTAIVPEATTASEHTSRNALNWEGTYTGLLPCADCEGISVKLTLQNGNRYTPQRQYKVKGEKPETVSGRFEWAADGQTVTLDAAADGHSYRVAENRLFMLNADGQQVTGPLADHYILKKQ